MVLSRAPTIAGVARFNGDVRDTGLLQILLCKRGEARIDFDRGDAMRELGQQRSLIARARTHFEYAVVCLKLK